ncbi:cell division protein ZipA [Marinomonas sp. 15G1-11]|uniref:Cell division protein ZipA n=1 Tax=Marinomonas phaeophyticola TaxID=3004091 RepID=A0ABT4JYM8_9GAMM|nr:cell division protein ZipA [Marinomonas sp. 15G1-11]MCZ2723330.1 cell division protein ZipA [Marinomonas sp. 15G1-11]
MEFSLREWLIVIGVLIIIVILIDGYRRYKKNNAFEDAEEDDFVDPDVLLKDAIIKRELPNGGARPVAGSEAVNSAFEVARKTSNAPLTDLPHKLDSGPLFQKDDHIHLDELASLVPERLSSTDESELRRNYSDDSEQFDVDETLAEEDFERNYSIVDVDQPVSGSSTEEFLEEDYEAEIEEVIVINVFSPENKPFVGVELLQLVLNCGMRYGEMDIFHRHEEGFDRGRIQFSMANAVEPGTFNIDTMGEKTFPGVSFFMGLPGPKNSMMAFDFMLETAQAIVRNLGGELKDERRNIMSDQAIAHSRQRIRDFERRRLLKAQ